MADVVAIVTGNLTAAGTWGLCDTASKNVSTNTGQTALTTGTLDSSTFVPAANALIGVALRLSSRAAGAPVTTVTVTLRNSTTATNAQSVTANVSDLPVCTTGATSEGGWHFFKFSASHTPNGADSYVIRATISATTIAVGFCTNGTANNWQRLLVRSTTQAPAAGDDMYLAQLLDGVANPATPTALVVTMDSTAATDYGSASTNSYISTLSISKGCALTWGVTAATTYILQLSGSLVVFSGGTYNQGTVATPIPTGSTGTLQFDNAADGNFGTIGQAGSTIVWQGLPRTSGKPVVSTLLTANASAAATSLTVADDTGWLNGDTVALGTTTTTSSQNESKVLSGNATATTMAIAAITNAHSGTSPTQGEVILLTRNVVVTSVTAGFSTFCIFTGTVDADWTDFRYCSSSTQAFVTKSIAGGNNVISFTYCTFRDWEWDWTNTGMLVGSSLTISNCTSYNCGANFQAWFNHTAANTCLSTTITANTFLPPQLVSTFSFTTTIAGLTFTNNRIVGSSVALTISCGGGLGTTTVISGNTFHGNGTGGSYTGISSLTIASETGWRNSVAVDLSSCFNVTFTSATWFGNAGTLGAFKISGACGRITLNTCSMAGDTSSGTINGLAISATWSLPMDVLLLNCAFGVASGIKIANSSADIFLGTNSYFTLVVVHTQLASTTKFNAAGLTSMQYGGYVAIQHYNQTVGDNRVFTRAGNLAIETTTVDVTPALKMTPLDALVKLESHAGIRGTGFLVGVASGAVKTISVKVQKDGTYNGNAPRLIQKANPAIGVTADVVLATHSAVSGSFQTLSAATAAATADGVIECVVDCDGTAGNVFVDTWTAV